MSRARGSAGLVALGTFLAAWPMATLFEPRSWLRSAALVLAVVAVVGVLARGRRLTGLVVVSVQGLAVAWTVFVVYAMDTLFYGLPTLSTLALIADRFGEALSTIQRYAAPAPATPGVEMALVLIVAIAGLAADALSETWLAPAAAGVPMLVLYLSAAANSGTPLNPAFFLAVAGVWATLVARRQEGRVRRWSTTVATRRGLLSTRDDQDDVVSQVTSSARVTGTSVVIGALVVAALLPHLPTRYLVEGLGRGGLGGGSAGSVIGLSSTLDVSRSLGTGRDDIILKYTTNAIRPAPLRVSVATSYSNGVWTSDRPDQTRPEEVPGPLAEEIPQLGQVTRKTMQFVDNSVPMPYLAVPDKVIAVDAEPDAWRWRPSTTEVRVDRELRSYRATYGELSLSSEDRGQLSRVSDPPFVDFAFDVSPETAAKIADLTASVVPEGASTYDTAIAIQNYLRATGGFTYSLALDSPVGDESPEQAFLRSKRGYCVQFATTMILMAHQRGIPARMVIGFLPGTLDGDEYIVRSSDAHAWPELYVTTLGWVRFEPTPGSRTGVPPAWTQQAPSPGGATTGPSIPRPSSTGRPVDAPEGLNGQTAGGTDLGSRIAGVLRGPLGKALAVLAVLGLITLTMPVTARLVRRHRRRVAESEQELVEVQWHDLVARLSDLGIDPDPTTTLRGARTHYRHDAHLDSTSDEALGRVIGAVEQVRYAATPVAGGTATALAVDARLVVARAEATRSRRDRIRAALFPRDGATWWSRAMRGVAAAPSIVVDWLITVGRRFRERRAS